VISGIQAMSDNEVSKEFKVNEERRVIKEIPANKDMLATMQW